MTPSGTLTAFPIPTRDCAPLGLAAGPDGNLWFTDYAQWRIGRLTP
jgi:streptogramin lyase